MNRATHDTRADDDFTALNPDAESDIRDTDIVFDCPYCGHGLVIDNRGAGLVITCTNCKEKVQVPIPEGMSISDFDETPETLRLQIRTLRTALSKSEGRERELQKLLAGVSERRATLEKSRTNQLRRLAELRVACERLQQQVSDSQAMLSRIVEMIHEEARQ